MPRTTYIVAIDHEGELPPDGEVLDLPKLLRSIMELIDEHDDDEIRVTGISVGPSDAE